MDSCIKLFYLKIYDQDEFENQTSRYYWNFNTSNIGKDKFGLGQNCHRFACTALYKFVVIRLLFWGPKFFACSCDIPLESPAPYSMLIAYPASIVDNIEQVDLFISPLCWGGGWGEASNLSTVWTIDLSNCNNRNFDIEYWSIEYLYWIDRNRK